ncbi:LAQU0S13e02872g1_1 [Lachancea quebecensis]|uniref:Pre-mRNA-splicing factor CWC15 n=1 Tax=Lachancea quebecensis TaxID=1654605 RepID=A0A0P1KVB5_9SACH|nr:LAQU0S13e02872g1_1 [Lachancea quebecensis]
MTTSHRPQLEARNGAKGSYVPTSTQHARLLPGHTKLKYRKRKLTDSDLEEQDKPKTSRSTAKILKDEKNEEVDGRNASSCLSNKGASSRSDGGEEGEEGESGNGSVNEEPQLEEGVSGSSEDEDEESDEEDQEALLRELNKIRQERMVQKLKEQREKQDLTGEVFETPTVQRSWRSQTVFGGQRPSQLSKKNADKDLKHEYTNDMTRSKFHDDFLRKYVR